MNQTREGTMKKLLCGAVAALAIGALGAGTAEAKNITVALVPGLTTDAFYITMHKGAQAAADPPPVFAPATR